MGRRRAGGHVRRRLERRADAVSASSGIVGRRRIRALRPSQDWERHGRPYSWVAAPLHIASYVFIGAGFWLIAAAWTVLWKAIRTQNLAATGPYARIRIPQDARFVIPDPLDLPQQFALTDSDREAVR